MTVTLDLKESGYGLLTTERGKEFHAGITLIKKDKCEKKVEIRVLVTRRRIK